MPVTASRYRKQVNQTCNMLVNGVELIDPGVELILLRMCEGNLSKYISQDCFTFKSITC